MSKAKNRRPNSDTDRNPKIVPSNFAEKSNKLALAITSPEFSSMEIVGNVKLRPQVTEEDLPALISALSDQSRAIGSGDMSRVEAMLINQATALQSLFTRLTLRGFEQPNMANLEGFLRLALRAQNQCRATLETLASIKNPPNIIAKQANVAIGGPQQVNNHFCSGRPMPLMPQNQLLEQHNESRMDAGTQATSSRPNSTLEALGTLNRPQNA